MRCSLDLLNILPNFYKIAWQHCNFVYLQTLIKTLNYLDAIQICFKLPTNAWGQWTCMIFREFKYI